MRIPGVKTVKNFSRWVQARLLGGALILGYHRIAQVQSDESQSCVAPENFTGHMEALSRYAHPVSLSELVRQLKEGSVPPRSVAVTFDDGYADNLYRAKPILEKYEIPATVFVCTGYAGREFWWDELERLVMSSRADVGALRLQAGEDPFVWDQPRGGSEADPSVRRKFCRALYRFVLGLDVDEQSYAMEKIRSWAGASFDGASSSRSMSHEELLQLSDGGLIELGSHTRNHPMLPRLSLEEQRDEIESGKRDLEAVLGRQVSGFSYPNGRATDDARRLVREAGFVFACTSQQDVVRPGSDRHELTRFWQMDVDGDAFLRGLRHWI